MEKRNDSIYKCISNSRYTPYLLAKKIGAIGILESASFQKGRERYSIYNKPKIWTKNSKK